MKYIWDVEKFSVSFREAAMRLLKWQNTDKGKDFIKQGIEQGAKQERARNDAANAAPRLQDGGFLALNRSFREKCRNSPCNQVSNPRLSNHSTPRLRSHSATHTPSSFVEKGLY